MKWIIWSRFPFAIFKIHYLCFGMTRKPPATSCKRFPKILCQVVNITMSKSSWFCYLDRFSIESEIKMNFNLQVNVTNLQMTFLVRKWSEAEKYFLHFKLISVACTTFKIKVQCTNSFDIATVNSTYLNNHCNILMNFCKWLTCLFSLESWLDAPKIQFCPFKVAPHDQLIFVASKFNLRLLRTFPKYFLTPYVSWKSAPCVPCLWRILETFFPIQDTGELLWIPEMSVNEALWSLHLYFARRRKNFSSFEIRN